MVLPGSLLLQARTNGYAEMVLDKSIRKKFLKELIRFCLKYNLDGACRCAERTVLLLVGVGGQGGEQGRRGRG